MDRVRAFLRVRNLMLCAVLVGAGFALYVATAPDAEAIAGPSVCTYYSNSTYKKAVGGRSVGCCGEITTWGQQTQWVKCQQVWCTDVLCPY